MRLLHLHSRLLLIFDLFVSVTTPLLPVTCPLTFVFHLQLRKLLETQRPTSPVMGGDPEQGNSGDGVDTQPLRATR